MIRINRPETSFLCRVPCRRALTVCPGTASGILTTFKNKGVEEYPLPQEFAFHV